MKEMQGKCECQICTCGRHRCPLNRASGSLGKESINQTNDSKLKSEYHAAYESYQYQPPRQAVRPAMKTQESSGVTMEIDTMYKQTFKQFEPTRREPMRRPVYNPPSGPIELTSTYDKDFTGQSGKRSESFKPSNAHHQSEGGVGDTMYRVTYREHGPDEIRWCRSTPIRQKESISRSPEKFDATSVMKEDFRRHQSPKRAELIRPKQESSRMPGKFDPETSYKRDFYAKPVSGPAPSKRQEYHAPAKPFDGVTTARADYQAPGYQKPQAGYKPQIGYKPCKAKFDDKTTVSDAYQTWPVQRRSRPVWANPKPTGQGMASSLIKTSSYQDDYIQPGAFQRVPLARPGNREGVQLATHPNRDYKKDCTTQYREAFKEFSPIDRPKSFKAINNYAPPKETFAVESCYQANFKGEYSHPAKICDPEQRKKMTDSPRRAMPLTSTYTDVYRGQRPHSCPAQQLHDQASKGEFQQTGSKNGHQYYVSKAANRSRPSTPKSRDASAAKSSGTTLKKSPSKTKRTPTPQGSSRARPSTPKAAEQKDKAKRSTTPKSTKSKSTHPSGGAAKVTTKPPANKGKDLPANHAKAQSQPPANQAYQGKPANQEAVPSGGAAVAPPTLVSPPQAPVAVNPTESVAASNVEPAPSPANGSIQEQGAQAANNGAKHLPNGNMNVPNGNGPVANGNGPVANGNNGGHANQGMLS